MAARIHTSRRGFTLTEALVAVFAVALISVGLASIFASVGRTVERGRRVSSINQFAAVVERQLREDMSRMTRDGFLVIRNEYAGGRTGVPLSEEAVDTVRPRRIDELLFFARGPFETARGPIDPALRTRSNEARIYYGHGQQQLEGAAGFFRPLLDDPNNDAELRLGLPGNQGIGTANPNFFAGDWVLLRHATLLARPAAPVAGGLAQGDSKVADNELQISLQPAADSVFRSASFWGEAFDASRFYDDEYADFSVRDADAPPTFPSGVVDIASENLSEIKRRVTSIYVQGPSRIGTADQNGGTSQPGAPALSLRVDVPQLAFARQGRRFPDLTVTAGIQQIGAETVGLSPASLFEEQASRVSPTTGGALLVRDDRRIVLVHAQQAWMADALPGASNEVTWRGSPQFAGQIASLQAVGRGVGRGTTAGVLNDPSPLSQVRSRMRYERTPPGFGVDVLSQSASEGSSVLLAAARADQQMVTSSQFVPRCTEFIVEFSFGERYTTQTFPGNTDVPVGELIWYGAPREGLSRQLGYARGVAALRPPASVPRPTQQDAAGNINEIPGVNAAPLVGPGPLSVAQQRALERHLLADLVTGSLRGSSLQLFENQRESRPSDAPSTFYFGYADPRAVPTSDIDLNGDGVISGAEAGNNRGFDLSGDGYRDDIDGDGVFDDSWPWPRLIRITMSFADPIDQTVEETFQFVFEVPADGTL
jgi:hypothetical protein